MKNKKPKPPKRKDPRLGELLDILAELDEENKRLVLTYARRKVAAQFSKLPRTN